jgi:hypothetical protein
MALAELFERKILLVEVLLLELFLGWLEKSGFRKDPLKGGLALFD